MKKLPEIKALRELGKIKSDYRNLIVSDYEHRAANCETCPTKGACCLDAHFVNVHISKLEAAAMREVLSRLSAEKRAEIYRRAAEAVEKYDLKTVGDTFGQTYACPLFEKDIGCLVHLEGKPAPCISHACYENQADLPPDVLQTNVETKIERLNKRVYGNKAVWLPIPVWLGLVNSSSEKVGDEEN